MPVFQKEKEREKINNFLLSKSCPSRNLQSRHQLYQRNARSPPPTPRPPVTMTRGPHTTLGTRRSGRGTINRSASARHQPSFLVQLCGLAGPPVDRLPTGRESESRPRPRPHPPFLDRFSPYSSRDPVFFLLPVVLAAHDSSSSSTTTPPRRGGRRARASSHPHASHALEPNWR